MLPLPFQMTAYGYNFYTSGLSPLHLTIFSHVPTAILAVVFGILVYRKTKKLSAFYLMLLCLNFGMWLYFDLVAWVSDARSVMFVWSVLDILNVAGYFIAYWFLYTFVRESDVPLWQKAVTACALIPALIITVLSKNIDSFFAPTVIALETQSVVQYNTCIRIFFLLLVLGFTVYEYRKALDVANKKKIILAGVGVAIFISFLTITEAITAFLLATNLFGWGETAAAYNVELYGLFGVPLFLGLLGYLIVKYQAFDLKVLKSVWLIIILMLLLFVTIFI